MDGEKSRNLLETLRAPRRGRISFRGWARKSEKDRNRGEGGWKDGGKTRREGGRVCQEIRNCRHIENHNSCEWRHPGIPGAYRDRYLDRVTINTDPWKVALSIIWGPCGEVTYTYLYPRTLPPLSLSFVFFPVEARYSESNYFRYASDIGARYHLCFTPRKKRILSTSRDAYLFQAAVDRENVSIERIVEKKKC